MKNYNISGYSTALFSTWFFIEDLGILFDVGDGVSANLLQKSRKIKHAFISHADRDHLTGLMQFNQLNARNGLPNIYFPSDSGSFPALKSFLEKFDPHVGKAEWIPIKEKMEFFIKGDIYVESIKNGHVPVLGNISKSLSYKIVNKKQKIKPEFEKLDGKEIAKISKEKGREFISYELREELFGYSGDTPVEDSERWINTKTLIHEATFLKEENGLNRSSNKHSYLGEVMEMVAGSNIEQLILSHFSSRYSKQEIDEAIKKQIKKYGIKIPVFRILPGEVHRDILSESPIN